LPAWDKNIKQLHLSKLNFTFYWLLNNDKYSMRWICLLMMTGKNKISWKEKKSKNLEHCIRPTFPLFRWPSGPTPPWGARQTRGSLVNCWCCLHPLLGKNRYHKELIIHLNYNVISAKIRDQITLNFVTGKK
jgi:hypothetical protein